MPKTKPAEWRNRIVSQGERPAIDFLASPNNPRFHPKNQQDGLSGILDSVGWIQNVIVSKNSGYVVDGHLRVELALSKGEQTLVPFVEVDLTEDEERLMLATFDPLSAMAATDNAMLADLLRSIDNDNEAVATLLQTIAEDNGIDMADSQDNALSFPQKQKVTCPHCGEKFEI